MEQIYEVGDIVVLVDNDVKDEANHLTIHDVQGATCVCHDVFGGVWHVSGDEIRLVREQDDETLLYSLLRLMLRNPDCHYRMVCQSSLRWVLVETNMKTGVVNEWAATNAREVVAVVHIQRDLGRLRR